LTISFSRRTLLHVLVSYEHAYWIQVAQDRAKWQALVNTKCTFGFHKRRGIS